MLSALLTGFFGAVVTSWVGIRYFGFDWLDCVRALGASNVSGFIALLLTLALERRAPIRRIFMNGAFKTWGVLAFFYTLFMVGLDPALRNGTTLAALFAPLVWATGFMIPLWGKTQDWVIRVESRRSKRRASKHNQEFAAPKRDVIRVES